MNNPLPLLLLLILAFPAWAEPDAAELFQRQCASCHSGKSLAKPGHKATDIAQLESWVRRCDTNLGLRWFDEDILAVTHYLNDNFYHHPQE
jgi:hypothetical protein